MSKPETGTYIGDSGMSVSMTNTLNKEQLTKLRKLGEKYYGNALYGEHLSYQHEMQALVREFMEQYALEARIYENNRYLKASTNGIANDSEAVTFKGVIKFATERNRELISIKEGVK